MRTHKHHTITVTTCIKCIHSYAHICTHRQTCDNTWIILNVRTRAHHTYTRRSKMHTCTCTHIHPLCELPAYTHTPAPADTHTLSHTHARTNERAPSWLAHTAQYTRARHSHKRTNAQTNTNTNTSTQTYTHTNTRTHIPTHKHTHTYRSSRIPVRCIDLYIIVFNRIRRMPHSS